MEQIGSNKKSKREKPSKKWSEKEIQSILYFLQEAPEVEAPTAQIFYKKLIESTKIDAAWDLIRWKVRHLKAPYKRASDWRMSTGAGLLESDAATSSVEGKVLQMCPHFNQLKHIFRKKATSELLFEVVDSGSTSIMNESAASQILEITFSDVGEDRRQMFKMKMEWEKKKHEKDHALNERRLQAEIERGKAEIIFKNRELDLKVLELEKDERLKKLQIEKEERLQRFEIEMKYKYSSHQ